ncbi:MAG: ImmA/IrrE family metallo-endopeptidase [Alkaliphilus sp.]
MYNNYYVSTGEILRDYINANDISQKGLSKRLGCSEKYLSNLMNGKARMTEDIAVRLESVFEGVKAIFWMNIEAEYRIALTRENAIVVPENIDEIAKKYRFSNVFKGLNWTREKQYREMLKLLSVENLMQATKKLESLNVSFMEDGGNKEAILVWLSLCKEKTELEADIPLEIEFDKDMIIEAIPKFKKIIYSENYTQVIKNIKRMLNKLGVIFICEEALPGSKVRGATINYKGIPAIYISTRLKYLDVIWFALFHELGHLINDYDGGEIISLGDDEVYGSSDAREVNANQFAREALIIEEDYNEFKIKEYIQEYDILKFAKKQKVSPGVVVGFMQHDRLMHGESIYKYSYLRAKI